MKKKGLAIAGTILGVAALAALTPYSCKRNEETDELTIKALLWKYTNKPDHELEGCRKVSFDLGFHNPFAVENDELLMDDEDDLILVDAPAESEENSECFESEAY